MKSGCGELGAILPLANAQALDFGGAAVAVDVPIL
jgi:hypothetical protein